jgi:hypothetical protein
MNRDWRVLGASIVCGLILACSTFWQPNKSALEWEQKQYVLKLRWNELAKTEQFVAPEDREELGRVLERIGSLRISDFDISPIELSEDGRSASVLVMYTGYGHRSLIERRLVEHQEWYVDPKTRKWKFRPRLESIQDVP